MGDTFSKAVHRLRFFFFFLKREQEQFSKASQMNWFTAGENKYYIHRFPFRRSTVFNASLQEREVEKETGIKYDRLKDV